MFEEICLECLLAFLLCHPKQHPEPEVELVSVDEERSLNVLLDYVAGRFQLRTVQFDTDFKRSLAEQFTQLFQRGKKMNPTSTVSRARLQDPQSIGFALL